MIWAAEQYCVENGARVITMSLGFTGADLAGLLRAERDNCANLRDAGVLLFNSAGNDHADFEPPDRTGPDRARARAVDSRWRCRTGASAA